MLESVEKKLCRISGPSWFFILTGVGLILLLDILYQSDNYVVQPEATTSANIVKMLTIAPKKRYIIDTIGCQIPNFETYSAEVSKYVEQQKIPICNQGIPPLVDSNATALYIINSSISLYGGEDYDSVDCCYKSFWRKNPLRGHETDDTLQYSRSCRSFRDDVEVSDEFVAVNCKIKTSGNETKTYLDFFSFAVAKDRTKNATSRSVRQDQPMSVLVLGFDAISRINFHRQLPLTMDFLKNTLGAVEMLGYNKVDDNTFPNLVPVLSGLSMKELKANCWKNQNTRFDKCAFVWKNYSDAGFLTAFGEDAAWMGLFTYEKSGFYKQPTDYYWRTFSAEAEGKIGSEMSLNANECVGSRHTYKLMLDYVDKFARSLSDQQYFAFFWETALSHDFLNKPAQADAIYAKTLQDLKASGALKNTVIIVMSDHGMRWGGIRWTHQGSFEDRLPGLFVSLPKRYIKKYPHVYDRLQRNAHLLTTPYDLHVTLKDLIDPFALTEMHIIERKKLTKRSKRRSYSLFEYIPRERNCEDAAIPIHWCTCQRSIEIDVDDKDVVLAVNYVMKQMNKELLDYNNCAALYVHEILKARIRVAFHDKEVEKLPSKIYQIVFRVKPGDGVFEATVRKRIDSKDKFTYNLEGDLSRLNVYGNQSKCVTDMRLKLYCYCLN